MNSLLARRLTNATAPGDLSWPKIAAVIALAVSGDKPPKPIVFPFAVKA